MRQLSSDQHVFPDKLLHVIDVELELHSIFWFHTLAQPRDKYVHVGLPLIHNYPLTIAFLGRPVEESYVSISNLITKSINARVIWKEYGFYIYPAIASKINTKTLLFSMSGTGYVMLKPKTRAPVPDITSHQIFFPGTVFKTYIITRAEEIHIPSYIRLGAKRYGLFKVKPKHRGSVIVEGNTGINVTHPFNIAECHTYSYYAVLRHYAGDIAITGVPKRIIRIRDVILAAPKFL